MESASDNFYVDGGEANEANGSSSGSYSIYSDSENFLDIEDLDQIDELLEARSKRKLSDYLSCVQLFYIKNPVESQTKIIVPIFIGMYEYERCPLITDRCFGIDEIGNRCKEFTCLIHPYCIKCTEKFYKVEIYENDQSQEFYLYCKGNQKNLPIFKKGEKIVPLFGEVLTKELFERRYNKIQEHGASLTHVYHFGEKNILKKEFFKEPEFYLDTLLYRGPGYYARKRIHNFNAFTEIYDDHLWLVANVDIFAGDEIISNELEDSPTSSPKKKLKSVSHETFLPEKKSIIKLDHRNV